MKREQRLPVLLRALRFGRWSAKRLASALQVSVRTIYRDIAALRAEGFGIRARCGPIGGYWRDYDAQPAPVVLSGHQIRELVLSVAAAARANCGMPAPEGAIDALLEALPANRAEGIRAMLASVLPGAACAPIPEQRSRSVDAVEEALHARSSVVVVHNERSQIVRPEKLSFDGATWSLGTYEAQAREARVFPIDEVTTLRGHRRPITFGLHGSPEKPASSRPLLDCALRIGGRFGIIGRSELTLAPEPVPRWRPDGSLSPPRPL